jgi:tRNA (guanine-N7-)-methyltransferase
MLRYDFQKKNFVEKRARLWDNGRSLFLTRYSKKAIMRPKNITYPHSWEERHVLIQDKIFFIPEYYDNYDELTFPGWEDEAIFGNSNPVHVEYCSGNGWWIIEKARENPEINWVAVEIRFDRVQKIWSKMKNFELKNLFIVCSDARLLTEHYIPKDSVSESYVNFPDPWPKDKHAKHRIVQSPFIKEVADTMVPGKDIVLVTDDKVYSEQMIEVMNAEEKVTSCYPEPWYSHDVEDYGDSFFGTLWRKKGRSIYFHRYRKK